MGQKVNPIVMRLSVNKDWSSKWYAKGTIFKLLHEDLKIRKYITKELKTAAISKVVGKACKKGNNNNSHSKTWSCNRKKGTDIEKIKSKVSKLTSGEVQLNIVEVRKPEIDAQLIADNIAEQLERRASLEER